MRGMMLLPALLVLAGAASPAHAGDGLTCRIDFQMSGWSAIYRTARGSGVVSCDNGQRLPVRISARGGGLTVGRARIDDGRGRFAGVDHIRDVIGGYAAADVHAGAAKSARAQVMTKGPVSLALAGTGEGWELGLSFGSFVIAER